MLLHVWRPEVLDPLGLELLQMVVSCLLWVLETELGGFSEKAASALKQWAISPGRSLHF